MDIISGCNERRNTPVVQGSITSYSAFDRLPGRTKRSVQSTWHIILTISMFCSGQTTSGDSVQSRFEAHEDKSTFRP